VTRRAPRERQAADFEVLSPVYWTLGPLMGLFPILLMLGLFVSLGSPTSHDWPIPLPTYIFLATIIVGALAMFKGSKVVLAEGGLWIRHYGVFKRFIPYTDITFVDTIQRLGRSATQTRWPNNGKFLIIHAVRLKLRSGKRVIIPAASEETEVLNKTTFSIYEAGFFGGTNATAKLLAGEVRARVYAEENQPGPTPAAAELTRGARSIAEWRAELAQRAPAGADAYRSDATTETLWRVVEDENAPRDARAGAAIALRRQLDADGRTRLRVVAEDCEPKLRVALDVALDDEVEEKEVLAALERASDRTE
jgi:hypothetical protein